MVHRAWAAREAQMARVPSDRVRRAGAPDENVDGRYVLYWMIAARRTTLELRPRARGGSSSRASSRLPAPGPRSRCGPATAGALRPLPSLRARWNARTTRAAFAELGRSSTTPYVEPEPREPARACSKRSPRKPVVVVTDDYPVRSSCGRMVAAAASRSLPVAPRSRRRRTDILPISRPRSRAVPHALIRLPTLPAHASFAPHLETNFPVRETVACRRPAGLESAPPSRRRRTSAGRPRPTSAL